MLFCYKRTTCDKVIVKILKILMDPSTWTLLTLLHLKSLWLKLLNGNKIRQQKTVQADSTHQPWIRYSIMFC